MKCKQFHACILAVVGSGLAGLSLNAETIVLAGSVQTMEGTAIAARISILRGPPSTGIETYDTAANGTFSISTSREEVQVIRAGATGYAGREITLLPTGPLPTLNFRLAKLLPAEGVVRSDMGVAQPGVSVAVRYIDSRMRMGMDEGSTAVTDENGAFTLLAAAGGGGRFVVDAFPDDWVPVSSAILGSGAVGNTGAGSGDTSYQDIRVGLKAHGARLSGLVTSPSGQALAGVIIRTEVRTTPARVDEGSESGLGAGVTPDGVLIRPFSQVFTKVVETDYRGNYEIRGLPEGSLTVSARRIGERPVVRTLRSVDGATLTASFTLGDAAGTTRTPRPTRVAPIPVPPAP